MSWLITKSGLGRRRATMVVRIAIFAAMLASLAPVGAQAPQPASVTFPTISATDLREWLTYLSSDELQGRQVFTEGYGVAAQFIADRLQQWGVKPLGDDGTYFQIVKLRSYQVHRNSSVTIAAGGHTTTFRDGDHVTFPAKAGGPQTLVFDGGVFLGAGPARPILSGKLVVVATSSAARGVMSAVAGIAVRDGHATASIEYLPAGSPPTAAEAALARAREDLAQATATVAAAEQRVRAEGGNPLDVPLEAIRGHRVVPPELADIPPTTERVDLPEPPRLVGDEVFFAALFGAAPTKFADIQSALSRGQSMPSFDFSGVKITIHVDNAYEPFTTQLSRNVVGMVEGSDPALEDTYVFFGAHLDHVGYAVNNHAQHEDGSFVGTVRNPIESDKIWNGADDDGTGTTAVMAIAKAFASGPRPKRSVVFIWHTGEEADLYGSRYNADFPVVPIERVQCELNIDMIGRNRDNDPGQANTVFVIGADRISTDLHNLIVDTDARLPAPLKLDYEYNDPGDPNSFYTRSDHYSYASKGIPIAFFFTGTHPDYHANSDSVEKILFPKQARVAQLVYEAGFAIADSPSVLRRDNRGARSGRGFSGKLP